MDKEINHFLVSSEQEAEEPLEVAYELFKILKGISKEMLISEVPILCLDELGYVFSTKEQADSVFQIISKRTEVTTTIITTNLILLTRARYLIR